MIRGCVKGTLPIVHFRHALRFFPANSITDSSVGIHKMFESLQGYPGSIRLYKWSTREIAKSRAASVAFLQLGTTQGLKCCFFNLPLLFFEPRICEAIFEAPLEPHICFLKKNHMDVPIFSLSHDCALLLLLDAFFSLKRSAGGRTPA